MRCFRRTRHRLSTLHCLVRAGQYQGRHSCLNEHRIGLPTPPLLKHCHQASTESDAVFWKISSPPWALSSTFIFWSMCIIIKYSSGVSILVVSEFIPFDDSKKDRPLQTLRYPMIRLSQMIKCAFNAKKYGKACLFSSSNQTHTRPICC